MKRFHVNINVADLQKSVGFYNTLFATEPTVLKSDYAKWMLDDPRINFAISQSNRSRGINHVGLQADTELELGEIQERLRAANQQTFDQPEAECCYAKSSKTWVRDPDQLAWETFVTHGQITHYGSDVAPQSKEPRCCA
jgi:catechol 2,3-dioxygenase-like lactoylglutathione lyase family enzyme